MTRRLQDFLSVQTVRSPQRTALVFKGRVTSYASLETSSNQLARSVVEAGCAHGDRVALLLPKSELAIISIFAALKAGCAYVPLDPTSPAARIARIVAQCEPKCILICRETSNRFAELVSTGAVPPGARVGSLDEGGYANVTPHFAWPQVQSQPTSAPEPSGTSADPAHILFTSGSTGTPKGVVITHANVIRFIDWALDYFQTKPGDRVSGHPPLHFDLSTFDIYGTIAAGAELHLIPPELSLIPHRLVESMRSSRLTQWFSVPSVLHHIAKADALRPGDLPDLERLLWCGEKFPTPALMYWMRRVPHAKFVNLYGPTETTIASSYHHVKSCPRSETEEIPIGRPCAGENLHVLDDRLQPAAPDQTGDLYISGDGLSPGYWRDPEKTAQVFIQHGAQRLYKTGDLARISGDGMIYLLGRADSQIKSRGYRIELGEIEAAVHALPGIKDAAVVAVDAAEFHGVSICCAFVPASGVEVSPPSLRRQLARTLPNYMLPVRWLSLDHLPLNGNGKVARPELKQHFLKLEIAG